MTPCLPRALGRSRPAARRRAESDLRRAAACRRRAAPDVDEVLHRSKALARGGPRSALLPEPAVGRGGVPRAPRARGAVHTPRPASSRPGARSPALGQALHAPNLQGRTSMRTQLPVPRGDEYAGNFTSGRLPILLKGEQFEIASKRHRRGGELCGAASGVAPPPGELRDAGPSPGGVTKRGSPRRAPETRVAQAVPEGPRPTGGRGVREADQALLRRAEADAPDGVTVIRRAVNGGPGRRPSGAGGPGPPGRPVRREPGGRVWSGAARPSPARGARW